jgi:D-arabinose 1-dehydrogenase-like Zn-dependent alcohol dehydrogenase
MPEPRAIVAAPFTAKLPAGVDFAQIAPVLWAGVTAYKGLIETEARAGQWVAIVARGFGCSASCFVQSRMSFATFWFGLHS